VRRCPVEFSSNPNQTHLNKLINKAIHLWLSHALECRLTNHSPAKNQLPQRSDTFLLRYIDFQHRRLIFLVSAGYYRRSFILSMVKRCATGICNTDTRFPERLEGGVCFFPSQNRSKILTVTSVVFGLHCDCMDVLSQLNPAKINKHIFFFFLLLTLL